MQEWMYPFETHHQFEHLIYNFEKFVDFEAVLENCLKKEFINKNRNRVIKHCSILVFNKILILK